MSLKFAVLGLLDQRPHYGYEIKQRFESSLGDIWSISYGQLYPTLRRLLESGHISKRVEPGKKAAEKNVYSITGKGHEFFQSWLEDSPSDGQYKVSVKDEFTLLFFFFDTLRPDRVLDILHKQLDRIGRQRSNYEKAFQDSKGNLDIYLRSIIRKGVIHLDAERQWLTEVIDSLRRRAEENTRPDS